MTRLDDWKGTVAKVQWQFLRPKWQEPKSEVFFNSSNPLLPGFKLQRDGTCGASDQQLTVDGTSRAAVLPPIALEYTVADGVNCPVAPFIRADGAARPADIPDIQ